MVAITILDSVPSSPLQRIKSLLLFSDLAMNTLDGSLVFSARSLLGQELNKSGRLDSAGTGTKEARGAITIEERNFAGNCAPRRAD